MSEWKETTIKESIFKANTGLDAIKRAPIVQYDSGIKCLRIQDVSQNNKFENWGFCEVTESNYKNFCLKNGDILIARTGNTIGVNLFIDRDLKAVFNNGLIRLKTINEKILPKYLFYLFQTSHFKSHIKSIAYGTSTQPNMQIESLLRFSFRLPPLEEQRAIASVLSCLDEKIENLRRQNETLESISQTLFKHWFIDFEFPNDDGKPYKSSGGEVRSTELGEIPKDWRVGKLGDVLSLIIDYRGKTPKKLSSDWSLTGIPALSAKNIKDGKIIREESMYYVDQDLYNKWMKDELKKHDILLTSEAPLGEIYYLANNNKYVLSQRLFALRVKNNFSSPYLYQWLKSEQGQFLLNRRATGSTVQGIRQVELKKVEIIIPEIEILEKITKLWFSILEKMDVNFKQIKTLTKTRDELLPKLMSGQLRVKDEITR
ncbi:restriction endonuclease subunit S [Geminocystis sp. CENA526]|uniref:restriction endonuclease subunit S n=1 Tax=Geminocystis sp. CENA526 TaxID=1355871 RepID=UPI003D6FBDAD